VLWEATHPNYYNEHTKYNAWRENKYTAKAMGLLE
jgi:hypothetical protein